MFESLDEIRTFVRVIEARSLSAAARELRVSTNAVWRRLERIEQRAGTRLVERTTRTLRVTEAGERIARRARRVLEELDAAEREVAATHSLRGTVRVAVSSDVASGSFLVELSELLREHPELRVEIISRGRLVEPVAGGVDLVVWPGRIESQTSTVRRVGMLAWALAAAPSYVARCGVPGSPDELDRHRCLLAVRGKRESTWTLVSAGGEARVVPVSAQLESDTGETLLSALEAGMGIGIRPVREVDEGVAAGRLVRILPEHIIEPMEISLVSPAGRLRSAHVRAVAAVLTRRLHWLMGR